MNEVKLRGRVVNQSRVKSTGTTKCMFNIEVKRTHAFLLDSNQCDNPKVIAYGDVAKDFFSNIKRGDVVTVTGWIRTSVLSTDGFNSYVTEIIADKIVKEEELNESL